MTSTPPPDSPAPAPPRCHHSLCKCPAGDVQRDGHAYCSASCADPEVRTLAVCPCGHAGCRRAPQHVDRPDEPHERPPPLVPPTVVI